MQTNSVRESPPLASTSHLGPPAPLGSSNRANGGGMRPTKSTSHSFTTDLATYLELQFIPEVKPTKEEYTIKETQRLFLQQLADTVSKGAKLLPFGSMANGFALKNSDMDLCCFLGKEAPTRSAAELVEVLGRLIEKETNFQVKMLPRARIPIIKLTLPPSPTIPFGMQCDIGFENRLALENTRLLLTYALVDNRLRTLVLFLKVWTKRRKINNPYLGTLSSYGYVLLVIYFLGHVKGPPVLPNLQRIPPNRHIPLEELEYEGHDIYFYDDLESLSNVWLSNNLDNSGQLLIEFFKFFSKDFLYNAHVISIRSEGGLISKEAKGWPTEPPMDADFPPRDQHKLCIEDPFQLDYNVARTVTTDGLYTIRGEFIRAYRILTSNPTERISNIINEVCEEREDFLVPHPPPSSFSSNPSPRRRSAPSSQYSNQQHYQPVPIPPTNTNAPGMEDFRIWAAKNGVGSATSGYSALDTSGGSNSRRVPTREEGWEVPNSPGYQFASLPNHQPPPPSHGSNQYYQNQNHLQHSSTSSSSSSSRRQHPGPLYPVPPPPPPHPLPSSSASATGAESHYSRSQPTNGPMPWLERRVSWDGTPAANGSPLPPTTTTGAAPMPIPTRPVDLHKFFQNQPMDPTSTGTSLMTTPTMSSESGQFGTHQGPGRSPYRYSPFSTNPTTTYGRGPSTSLPPRPTYPFPSSSLPATPSQYYSSQHHSQFSHQHYQQQLQQQQQQIHQSPILQPARYHHPGPFAIFPIEDRETIIQANTITFGNFDTSLQPFFPFPYGQNSVAGSIRGLGSEAASPEMGWPSPTFSHPLHPAPLSHSFQNGFGAMGGGLIEGFGMESNEDSMRGRRLSSSLPGSTISPSPSLAHPILPRQHHPSAAGLLFDTPSHPPDANSSSTSTYSHSSTSLEAYRTRFRDLHARTRGRSMPHSSTITKKRIIGSDEVGDEESNGVIDGVEEGLGDGDGAEEDGEGEREVAMVKFGEVETEFFLPFPTRRPAPIPTSAAPEPSVIPPPTALPIVERDLGVGEVDSPDEMSELSIEVEGEAAAPGAGAGAGMGVGDDERRKEGVIPRFNTIPPTPVKQRIVESPEPSKEDQDAVTTEEEIVPIPIPILAPTSTTTTKKKSRSTNQSRINGTRSPKLVPSTSSPSLPSSLVPRSSPPTPTTTTTKSTRSKSSPKLPSSPLLNGVNSWATVTRSGSGSAGGGGGAGGDRVGPIRLAAMNGISKLNLATSKRTTTTSSNSSPVLTAVED